MHVEVSIVWLVGAASVVLVAALGYRAHRRRQAALAAWAADRGWSFVASDQRLTRRWTSPPFGIGHSRRALEVLTGEHAGRRCTSFSYVYTTGGGKNRSTHTHHVVAMELPVALPWLQLTPEGAGTAVAKLFGGQDVTFESAAFNEAWRVKAPPGQFAHDVIHPRMMERLLAPDALGRPITVEGRDVYVWSRGRQRLEDVDHRLHLLLGIVETIPRHVWLKAGHDPLAETGHRPAPRPPHRDPPRGGTIGA